MIILFFCIIAYLVGSINSAVMLSKFFGLPSPYTIASGNPGTTNMLRLGGKKIAALTLFFDTLKGVIPIALAIVYFQEISIIIIVGCCAVLGHIYSLFLKFSGGKGVATMLGLYLALNIYIGLMFIAVWLIIAKLSKISSLSALFALLLSYGASIIAYGVYASYPLLLMTLLIFYKHKINIIKILNKQEAKIGQKKL